MRWSEDKLREHVAKRHNSAAVARSEAAMSPRSLPGIPDAPAAEKAPPKRKPLKLALCEPSEAAVLDAIRRLLRVHPAVAWHTRINSGAMTVRTDDGRQRFVRFHDCPGMSDILGQLVSGKLLAIEVKRPSWRGPSDEREQLQAEFIRRVCEAGGLAFTARSVEEALVYLGPLR